MNSPVKINKKSFSLDIDIPASPGNKLTWKISNFESFDIKN